MTSSPSVSGKGNPPPSLLRVYKWTRHLMYTSRFWLFLLAGFYGVMFWYAGYSEEMPLLFRVPITLFFVVVGIAGVAIGILLLGAMVYQMVWDEDKNERISSLLILSYLLIVVLLGLAGFI